MAREHIDDLPAPQSTRDNKGVTHAALDFTDVDVADHLNYLYRGTHGYVCLATLDRSNGARPKEQWFKWPDQRDEAIAWVNEVKDRPWVEVFYCVNPMRTKDRAAGNSSTRYVIHADVDTLLVNAVSRKLRRLGFRLVASGTPGRSHVLARLSRSLTIAEHRAAERALQRLTRADAKISDNDYLRMPGTWNNKHHPSVDANKRNDRKGFCEISVPGKEVVSADRLMTELNAQVTDADTTPAVVSTEWTKVRKPRIPDRVLMFIDVEPEEGQRSAQCYAAVAACVEAGWDRDQIHTVLDGFAPGVEKWGDTRWHTEIDRILVKRQPDGGLAEYNVEESFWGSRSMLQHIFNTSLASLAGPWATLGVVMTRMLHCIPANVKIPLLSGGPGGGGSPSLNLFVALIGTSGGGKMTATTAGSYAVETGQLIRGMSIGSGEGISKAFKGKGEGDSLERKAIWFDVSEVTTWNAIASRQGATLSAEICRAWSGEALGFQNADREKTNHVLPQSYRMTLVIGAQPGQCGPLLGSIDMGLPQRFLFLPTWYDDIPEEDLIVPDPWAWEPPAFDKDGYTIKVPDQVRQMMRTRRRDQMRSDYKADPLESHAMLIRLRVSVALALMDDRVDVSEEDWELAGIVMHVHQKTRTLVMETLSRKRRIENVKRGRDRGEQELAAKQTVDKAHQNEVSKVADLLEGYLDEGPLPGGRWKTKLAHRRRPLFAEAVALLVSSKRVTRQPVRGGGTDGYKYAKNNRD